PGPEGDSLGDVAIAWETVAAEAAAAGLSLRDHVLHLVLHATLHLLGYDHLDARDAALMEGIETETLVSMGLRDPYSETDPQDGSPFRLET
ncbi:MAG: rRNA maturation RNase YbeY, partial [Alphaproteobacteria bacterium]